MSKKESNGKVTPQVLKFGKHQIPSRITYQDLKRLKDEGGIDLLAQDPQIAKEFAFDASMVIEAGWFLYSRRFKEAGVSQDEYYDLCDVESVESLRGEVNQQMRGFSPLWKIADTVMEEVSSGSTEDLMALAEKARDLQGTSGLGSSPQPSASDST